MLLLFTVAFGSAGCGGGHSSRFVNNDPDEPIPDRIFTVTFNSNGGSPVASQNVLEGQKAIEPNEPTKENFLFGGWYSNSALTERFSFNTPITRDIVLYARWNTPSVITYTITFNTNGGSPVKSQNVVEGEKAVQPADPTRSSYVFDGWYSDEDLTLVFSFDTPITSDVVLYAKWNAVFIVSFNSDGGSKIPAQTVLEYAKAEVPEDPVKEGYTFLGWKDEDENSFVFDYEVILGDTVLTAEWGTTLPSTEEELSLMESTDIVGENSISFDNSPVVSVSVEYIVNDGTGMIGISTVSHDPMLDMPGLIGDVLSFNEIGDASFDISEAVITFQYDPNLVQRRANAILAQYQVESLDIGIDDIDIHDLSVYWYDASDDVVRLLGKSIVDTANNTVSVSTDHFCNIGLALSNIFTSSAKKRLPAVRTNTTPYYDVVMALDYSGSMSYSDIRQSIAAAQGLIDILADDDYVSVIAFATYARAVVEHKRVGDGRDSIKQSIPSNPSVGGGTSFEAALSLAKTIKPLDSLHQLLVVLLSDGGSSISDTLLQELKDNDQKVITVGIGSGVNANMMQRIADSTGGSYIFSNSAEDLQNAFLDLQSTYIGSTKDTDGDGLPDLVEVSGMRDQYGKIWRTDPNNANTDGDEFSDGEEMGEYQPRAEVVHFKRKSNPLVTTKYTGRSEMKVSEEMLTVEGRDASGFSDNTITVMIDVYDRQYKIENGVEYLYSPAKNVKVNIIKYPDNVMTLLPGWPITQVQNDSSSYKHYVTCAKFSYVKDFIFSPAIWEINADGTTYRVDLGGLWERPHFYKVRNALLKTAQSNMREVKRKFVEAMQSNIVNVEVIKPEESDEFKVIKQEIQNVNPSVSEEYCSAFALLLMERIAQFEESKPKSFNLFSETGLSELFGSIFTNITDQNGKVTYGGNVYTFNGTVYAGGFSSITVRKQGTSRKINLSWVSSPKRIKEKCKSYLEALKNTNDEAWGDALEALEDDLKDVLNVPGLSDALITFLCDNEVTREAMKDIVDTFDDFMEIELGNDSFKDYLEDGTKAKLREFKSNFITAIKRAINGGNDFVKSAGKIAQAEAKLKIFEEALKHYSPSDAKKTDSDIAKAWGDFKSAYEAMGGTGIFGHWVLGLGYFNDRIPIPSLDDYH